MTIEKINTLMIEDNEEDAMILNRCLRVSSYFDYRVTVAQTMAEGRKQVGSGCYELILLDLRLPNGSGVALVKELRECAPNQSLVVVSGMEDSQVEIQSLTEQADEFIVKGKWPESEVRRLIRNAVIKARSRNKFAGINKVAKEMESTLKECEISSNLPPFKT